MGFNIAILLRLFFIILRLFYHIAANIVENLLSILQLSNIVEHFSSILQLSNIVQNFSSILQLSNIASSTSADVKPQACCPITSVSFGRCNYLDFHTLVNSSTISMFLNIHKKSDFLAGSQCGWLQRGNCMIDTKLALATFHIFRSVDVLQSLLYLYNMQNFYRVYT